MDTLSVYFEQRRVGTMISIRMARASPMIPGWVGLKGAFPISITMPLGSERIASGTFLPWAANLLPERRATGNARTTSRDGAGRCNRSSLRNWRRHRGGAFNWSSPGEPLRFTGTRLRSRKTLERLIEELPSKPFLVGDEGVSMSLAGSADQVSCSRRSDRLRMHSDERLSFHAHSQTRRATPLGQRSDTEAFCLTLARRMKFRRRASPYGQAGKRNCICSSSASTEPRSAAVGAVLHQEDYCQDAREKPPSAKVRS